MGDALEFKCPYIDKETIWEAAEQFRKDHWPESSLPVDIEKIVENRLSLRIEPEHNLLNDYDIDAYLRTDLCGIVVDYNRYMNDKYINRLRFSFAHELGHFILHSEIYSRFGITTTRDWKNFMTEISERDYKHFEYQANEFAGRVLVPRDHLKIELGKCIDTIQQNTGLIDIIATDPSMVLTNITPTICKSFGVSDSVIERRVDREGMWPPEIKYIDGVGTKIIR